MMYMLSKRIVLRLLPLLLIALGHRAFWNLACALTPSAPSSLRSRSIVLLIAHPDDESMFFAPTVQALTSHSLSNNVRILCLSTGNSAGLGAIRRKELEIAALMLGVRQPQDVIVVDDEIRFKDDIHLQWDDWEVADLLASTFASQASSASWSSMDVLLTFDSSGVSSHPNHISLYYGARRFLKNLMLDNPTQNPRIDLYTLKTVSVFRHYDFVFDIIPTSLSRFISFGWTTSNGEVEPTKRNTATIQDKVIFVANPAQYWNARKAMVKGHRSQSVWFRWPWINMGRYMVVNHLQREQVSINSG